MRNETKHLCLGAVVWAMFHCSHPTAALLLPGQHGVSGATSSEQVSGYTSLLRNCYASFESSLSATGRSNKNDSKQDNKAMAFLKKIGKIGGTKVDFTHAVGVDEGSGGTVTSKVSKVNHDKAMKKAKHAYLSCTQSGTIDDLTETFPITSSGTEWAGVTDKVMGGKSSGTLVREDFQGRLSNVLTANVSLENDGGFVQMVTDLALDPAVSNTVDASNYDGLELDLFYQGPSETEDFNVHLKDSNCLRQFSSYRATFRLTEGEWTTVRLPWSKFEGFGWGAVENLLNQSALRRIGIVAIGKEMNVRLALSSIRFLPREEE